MLTCFPRASPKKTAPRLERLPRRTSFVYRPTALPAASPVLLFSTATCAVLPLYAALICAPRSRRLRLLVQSDVLWLALAALYFLLLAASWQADTHHLMFSLSPSLPPLPALPSLTGVSLMFSRPAAAAAAWVHLLVLDLFMARFVFLDALRRGVPAAHSLALCCMVGPLGLGSHIFTVAVVHWRRRRSGHHSQSIHQEKGRQW